MSCGKVSSSTWRGVAIIVGGTTNSGSDDSDEVSKDEESQKRDRRRARMLVNKMHRFNSAIVCTG